MFHIKICLKINPNTDRQMSKIFQNLVIFCLNFIVKKQNTMKVQPMKSRRQKYLSQNLTLKEN